jgi:DNA-binding response OmpR family regulator
VIADTAAGRRLRPRCPVIVLAAADQSDDVQRGYSAHANAYVVRPADDELRRVVGAVTHFFTEVAVPPPVA